MRPARRMRRIGAGPALAALLIAGTAVLLIDDWRWLLALAFGAVGLHLASGGADGKAPPRAALVMLALVFGAQAAVAGWRTGLVVTLRLVVMLLLAGTVNRIVPAAALTRTLERLLTPLRHLGIGPARLALALSLTIRFVPLLADLAGRLRETQRARGGGHGVVPLAVPLVVQSLKMADDLAAAIEARGFDGEG